VGRPAFYQVTQARFHSSTPNQRAYWMSILMEMKRETVGVFPKIRLILSWGENLPWFDCQFWPNVFEYFPPIPKDKLKEVAQLADRP